MVNSVVQGLPCSNVREEEGRDSKLKYTGSTQYLPGNVWHRKGFSLPRFVAGDPRLKCFSILISNKIEKREKDEEREKAI